MHQRRTRETIAEGWRPTAVQSGCQTGFAVLRGGVPLGPCRLAVGVRAAHRGEGRPAPGALPRDATDVRRIIRHKGGRAGRDRAEHPRAARPSLDAPSAGAASNASEGTGTPLPAVVSEGLVGLRHAVDVVLALVRAALLVRRVEQLVRQALGHRLLAALARELDQPADGEGARAAGGDLDRDLVRRAADAAGADLEDRGERLDRVVEDLKRVAAAALADDRQRVVDDALGDRLLAVQHDLVDHLLDEARAVDGIGLDGPDLGGGAAGHRYFFLTPYCERAFLRSLTPAASSVPRTTL